MRSPARSTGGRAGTWLRGRTAGFAAAPVSWIRESAVAHRPVRFPLQFAVAQRVALVVQFLSLDQGDLRLGSRSLEVERERDAGDPARRDGAGPPVELPPVQKELAVPLGKVIGPGAGAVRGDVRPDQERLARTELDVGILQLRAPFPKRLDLGARQNQPRFGAVLDEVIVEGLAVGRDGLRGRGLLPRLFRPASAHPAESIGPLSSVAGPPRECPFFTTKGGNFDRIRRPENPSEIFWNQCLKNWFPHPDPTWHRSCG